MKIRELRPADLAKVLEIEGESFDDPYDLLTFLYLLGSGCRVLVAEEDGEVMGYIAYRIEDPEVVSLAVRPDKRGRGIGRALLRRALDGLKGSTVRLHVAVGNEEAIRLYESLGFRIRGKIPGYYRNGEDAYIMVIEP